ncbi:hypothetical protein PBV87_00705 [Niameybacter massiliensis]|uniref:Uncharacterized protein n=1 Tax=Holtiella tumoricola TaxID=3018743 RepID=A0AA42DJD1_9FIRM|nr:hypothetical protein [Holtiella tumoricola]MDA3730032.1 hypothetical protein [Holtiella tumoricola]
MRSEFRNIDKVYGYEVDQDKYYIEEADYEDRITDIETAVSQIEEKLEEVRGIELIDEVKEMLERLADKLY